MEHVLLEDISGHISKRRLATVTTDQPNCLPQQKVCHCGTVNVIHAKYGKDFNTASYSVLKTKLRHHGLVK